MKPRVKQQDSGMEDLFRSKLKSIINLQHELVRLGALVDWARLEAHFAPYYKEVGRPGSPIRLVVVTQYRPGAEWTPAELSPADTVLALLQHTFRGMDQAERSIPMLRVAAAGAIGVKGDRGDAEATATDLLARLTHSAADEAPAAGG